MEPFFQRNDSPRGTAEEEIAKKKQRSKGKKENTIQLTNVATKERRDK